MTRLFKYLLNILLVLASLVALLLVFLYFAPGPLIRPLANTYLNTVGFPIEEVKGARFTFNKSRVSDLTISNDQNTFILHELELKYRFSQLLQGKVEGLHIGEVELVMVENQEQEVDADSSLADMVELTKMMPLNTISVGTLHFNNQFQLNNLNFDLSPENFNATLDYEEYRITSVGNWVDSNRIEGNLVIGELTDNLAQTSYAVTLKDQSLSWQGQGQLNLTQLSRLSVLEEFFASHHPTNTSILVESEFAMDNVLSELTVPQFSLSLSSEEETELILISELDSGTLHSRLDLPVKLTGMTIGSLEAIRFDLTSLTNEFTWVSDAFTSNGNLSLSQISGNCTLQFYCSSNQQLQLALTELQMLELPALNLVFQGEFSSDKMGDEIKLKFAEQAQITLSELATDQLTASSVVWQTLSESIVDYSLESSNTSLEIAASNIELTDLQSAYAITQLDVELTDIHVDLQESFRANLDFSSNKLIPGLDTFSPINPGFKGSLTYQEDIIELGLDLLVKNQQVLSNQLTHDLTGGNGNALLELPETLFSNITPLSSFFEELPVTAELISGSVSGRAELAWDISDPDSLQLSGPIDLSINSLGGFYNETVFVGLQTHILAQVDSATEVQSSKPLEATVETLDIGTEVENVRLRYQFDSAGMTAIIEDFYAELLGGSISVAEFDYQQQRARNLLNINLNAVQLNTIAAMAQYPDLYVDGAVSGQVPVIISPDAVTVENGVILAVEPGGVIRYTPANPAPNPNPTMQLVNDALSNYHYSTLDSDVIYDENGDLILAVKMQGANPDLNAGQAINLNVNITDNIPTLLRSLQASRVITDTLEEALQERQDNR